jgi:hypothetical protein
MIGPRDAASGRIRRVSNLEVACMHRLLPKYAQATLLRKGILQRAVARVPVPAVPAPAWTRSLRTNVERGSGIRCYAILGRLPMVGKWFTKAQEPGAPSIEAVKQKTSHALKFAALAGQPTPPPPDQGARITGNTFITMQSQRIAAPVLLHKAGRGQGS